MLTGKCYHINIWRQKPTSLGPWCVTIFTTFTKVWQIGDRISVPLNAQNKLYTVSIYILNSLHQLFN